VHDNLEPTVPVLEKQVHSKDLGLAELMHAARRVGARLILATKFWAPVWLPSVEESEQLAELQGILAAKPQQFRPQFFGGAGGPRPHILGESEGTPMKALVKQKPESQSPQRARRVS